MNSNPNCMGNSAMAWPRHAVFMSFSLPNIFQRAFQRLSPFISSHRVEVSGYQSLSILRDVISDNMSLVVVQMTLSFSLFLSFFPLSKWNSCKILETLLFNITRADFPSCWQHSFRFLLMRKGSFWFSLPTTEVGKKKPL